MGPQERERRSSPGPLCRRRVLLGVGRASANTIAEYNKPGDAHNPWPANAGEESIKRIDRLRNASGPQSTHQLRDKLQRAMQKHAAVFRDQPILEEGVQVLDALALEADQIGIKDRSMIWNTDLIEALEFENLLASASVT